MSDELVVDGDMMYLKSKPNIRVSTYLHPRLLYMLQDIDTDADVEVTEYSVRVIGQQYNLFFKYELANKDYVDAVKNIDALRDIVEMVSLVGRKIAELDLHHVSVSELWSGGAITIWFDDRRTKHYRFVEKSEEDEFISWLLDLLDVD